jgi:hypothetical protein
MMMEALLLLVTVKKSAFLGIIQIQKKKCNMQAEEFNAIWEWFTEGTYPKGVETKGDKNNWRKKMNKFVYENDRLKRKVPEKVPSVEEGELVKTTKVVLAIVVRADELPAVLHKYHGDKTHLCRDMMMPTIRAEVWWRGKKRDIDDWIRSCIVCQKHNPSGYEPPLRPIIVLQPNRRHQLDYTGTPNTQLLLLLVLLD